MPQSLPLPPSVTGRARHCTRIGIAMAVGGPPTLSADFTIREALSDGTTRDLSDGSCSLSAAELSALPAFADAYVQLRDALHAKRAEYD